MSFPLVDPETLLPVNGTAPVTGGTIQVFSNARGLPIGPKAGRRDWRNWVYWDENTQNVQPNINLALYNESPTHRGILDKKVEYAAGVAIDYTGCSPDFQRWAEKECNRGNGLHQLLNNLIKDYLIHGNYLIAGHWNHTRPVLDAVEYADVSFHRRGFDIQAQSFDDVDKFPPVVWRCWDWEMVQLQAWKFYQAEAYPVFDKRHICPGETVLNWCFDANPGLLWYGTPDWFAGSQAIKNEINVLSFLGSKLENAFSPNGVLEVPVTANPETEAKVQDMLGNLVGAANAGGVAILRTAGEMGIKFIPFVGNNTEDGALSYDEIITQKIVTAHGLSSPTVAGLPGGASLGGDAGTIETAVRELERRMIVVRERVMRELGKMLNCAGWVDEPYKIINVLPPLKNANVQPALPDSTAGGDKTDLPVQQPVERASPVSPDSGPSPAGLLARLFRR